MGELTPLNDPIWLTIIKLVLVLVILLTWTIFNVWFERRVLGRMQNRRGPTMNGPLGLGQALGDGLKLFFKEDFRPARTDAFVYTIAPMLTVIAAFTSWTVIPLGGNVNMFGVETRLQVADFPASVLFILAVAGVGFYGFVLAGWASSGTYSLLGSMRATAQVISYEVTMGIAIVAVFLMSSSMSTGDVVNAQDKSWIVLPGAIPDLPSWNFLILLPSFIIFVISMFGETNRLPFDFAECESEIVSGHITDYSGFRYALFFLAEYINMATTSAVATTLFLGGYHAPWPLNGIPALNDGWITLLWFILKIQVLIFFYSWVRGALPRTRYDVFMNLGWKWMLPIGFVWTFLVAIFRFAGANDWTQTTAFWIAVALLFVVVIVAIWFGGGEKKPEKLTPVQQARKDKTLPGAYPVPVLGGESGFEVFKSTAAQTSDEDNAIKQGADA